MIAGRRDAIASIASHSPSGATASRISVHEPRTWSSWPRTPPGLNRRDTRLRCCWCAGSSMLIIERSARWSICGRDPENDE